MTRGVSIMAQRIKQFQIGIIKSEKEVKEAIPKIKELLTNTLEEIRRTNGSEVASDSLVDNIAQVMNFILDKAGEVTQTEDAKKVFNQITQETGYSEKQLQAILETVKKTMNSLI